MANIAIEEDETKYANRPWIIRSSKTYNLMNYLTDMKKKYQKYQFFQPEFSTRKDLLFSIVNSQESSLHLGIVEFKSFNSLNCTAFEKGAFTTQIDSLYTEAKSFNPRPELSMKRQDTLTTLQKHFNVRNGCLRILITSPPSNLRSSIIGGDVLLILDRESAPSLFDEDLWNLISSTVSDDTRTIIDSSRSSEDNFCFQNEEHFRSNLLETFNDDEDDEEEMPVRDPKKSVYDRIEDRMIIEALKRSKFEK